MSTASLPSSYHEIYVAQKMLKYFYSYFSFFLSSIFRGVKKNAYN